ncbi:2-hydroxyacid dehydrogenase [Roseomonas sp. BN140053]|uniref:2-hydroxyacid dehydrogenase n=1 Tax=Roseomonas sp. BN140053 TaxID=3391898 RepID=UPI0039E9FB99
MDTIRVFYTAFAPEVVYDAIRRELPADARLVTLSEDSEAERRAAIAGCEVAIMATMFLSAELMAAAPALKLVLHQGVGYQDTLDLDAMRARGIRLAVTPEGTITSVAEHAVLLMLAACRRLPHADAELRAGRFHRLALRPVSRELRGKRVGFLGMGRIGQEVAARLAGFETTGLYFDRSKQLPPEREAAWNLRKAGLEEVLRESDIITLHLPLTPASRGMIDAAAIARMKPGAILINTARGGLVDEEALADALEDGRVLAAGLDVFEHEPYPATGRLAGLPNVVLTPHLAGGTADAFRDKMRVIGDNISRFRAGQPLRHEILL